MTPKNNDSPVIINWCKSTPRPWLTSLKWLPSYFNLVNDNSPELLFPRKKQLPSVDSDSVLTGHCMKSKADSKKNMTVGLKHPTCVLSKKLSPFGTWKFQKKSKFYKKIINKCDWTTLSRKNINIYVSAIEKLLSVDFSIKFASFLSLSQTKSVSLPSLIKWVQCHIFYFYYCYSEIIQIHAFYKQQKAEIGEKSSKC